MASDAACVTIDHPRTPATATATVQTVIPKANTTDATAHTWRHVRSGLGRIRSSRTSEGVRLLAVAVAAVEAFFGRPLDAEVVQEALTAVIVPGRFEVAHRSPLIVLDSAHNPDGTAAAAATFEEEFQPDGSLTLMVGLLGGRDVEDTLAPLVALGARRIVCVEADSARAVSAVDVASAVSRLVSSGGAPSVPEVTIVDDIPTAIDRVTDRMGIEDALLIAGSTYVVGTARAALRDSGLLAG